MLLEALTSQGVLVAGFAFRGSCERCSVGAASDFNKLAFVILELHNDVNSSLLFNLVVHVVGTVVIIDDLGRDFLLIGIKLNENLELVTTR